ncbi:hypothetical protein BJY00DRAFT_295921 [Aspergillus carlsbadensis]|nr:hypothetical protein BJY00DRAFT_295921 [Aspergillus carlsbadensis]
MRASPKSAPIHLGYFLHLATGNSTWNKSIRLDGHRRSTAPSNGVARSAMTNNGLTRKPRSTTTFEDAMPNTWKRLGSQLSKSGVRFDESDRCIRVLSATAYHTNYKLLHLPRVEPKVNAWRHRRTRKLEARCCDMLVLILGKSGSCPLHI